MVEQTKLISGIFATFLLVASMTGIYFISEEDQPYLYFCYEKPSEPTYGLCPYNLSAPNAQGISTLCRYEKTEKSYLSKQCKTGWTKTQPEGFDPNKIESHEANIEDQEDIIPTTTEIDVNESLQNHFEDIPIHYTAIINDSEYAYQTVCIDGERCNDFKVSLSGNVEVSLNILTLQLLEDFKRDKEIEQKQDDYNYTTIKEGGTVILK